MAKQRILIIGFSNVAVLYGFSIPLIERMSATHPDTEIVRVGLGGLLPQVIPPYIRASKDTLGDFTHVMMEITSSVYSHSRLATNESATELLLDCLHAVKEIGAQPSFMLHYRNREGKELLDFEGLTCDLAAKYEVPVLNLSSALVDEFGLEHANSLLRDKAHTTEEGSELFAERAHSFLSGLIENDANPKLDQVPLPQWRRELLQMIGLMDQCTKSMLDLQNIMLPYAIFDGNSSATIDLGETTRVMALTHVMHSGGGHCDIVLDGVETLKLTSIDPMSHFTRISATGLDFFRGKECRTIEIKPIHDAAEVTLLRREKTTPLINFIGAPIVMRPTGEAS